MAKTLVPKSFKAEISRAMHNLYQEKRTTLHPMTLVPIYYRRMFKGDTFNFGILESILRSEPTFAPLLGNWRLRFEWYFDSDANRYGWIDNNTRLTSEEVMNRKHHTLYMRPFELEQGAVDFDLYYKKYCVGKGSLNDYAGIPAGYSPLYEPNLNGDIAPNTIFNIDFHLTYLNIIRNYHVNKQFPNIPYVSNQEDGVTEYFRTYSLDDLDNLFMFLRSCPNGVEFDYYGADCVAPQELKEYYVDSIRKFYNYLESSFTTNGGLFCSQFEPDLYQNLLSKDQALLQSRINVAVDANEGAGFTIEQFRLKNHLQGLYDKIFVSGGTDRELSRTIWGVESNRDYDIPELICVHSEIIGTNLVESNNASQSVYNGQDIENAPGSMAGNINTRRGAGRIQKFTAKTSGSLMCIVSLVPIVDYCLNIERHLLEHNFMDEFTPDMARKGFENVPLSDYSAIRPYTLIQTDDGQNISFNMNVENADLNLSVGKQIAWLREMTATNRVHGEFTWFGDKKDWVLLRDYFVTALNTDTQLGYNLEITPYGSPLAFQYPFVSQSIYDPNFYLQVAIKCDAYRPVPRRFMPNLGY